MHRAPDEMMRIVSGASEKYYTSDRYDTDTCLQFSFAAATIPQAFSHST